MKKYGSNWENSGVTLPELGIIIAPEIFTVRRNVALRTGMLILKGTKYFTWDTARELVWNNYTPKGWRLPTAEETDIICSAIWHHDNKAEVNAPMDEVLKDADVIHHSLADPTKEVKEHEKERFALLCEEFGMR